MADTKLKKRDSLMTQTYFDELIKFYEEQAIPKYLSKINDATTKQTHRVRLRYRVFLTSYQLLLLRYSQGQSIASLKQGFPTIIDALEAYQREAPGKIAFLSSLDQYVVALWLVSLAILFDVEEKLFERLITLINNDGQDQLYESLVGARVNNRPPARRLLYPRPYKLLFDAIIAQPKEQAELMAEFLQIWYSSMKDAYWYQSHLGPDGGGFFGYWCIEAAGVVKAFGIDDTSFSDMPYYPKDLVHPQEPQS